MKNLRRITSVQEEAQRSKYNLWVYDGYKYAISKHLNVKKLGKCIEYRCLNRKHVKCTMRIIQTEDGKFFISNGKHSECCLERENEKRNHKKKKMTKDTSWSQEPNMNTQAPSNTIVPPPPNEMLQMNHPPFPTSFMTKSENPPPTNTRLGKRRRIEYDSSTNNLYGVLPGEGGEKGYDGVKLFFSVGSDRYYERLMNGKVELEVLFDGVKAIQTNRTADLVEDKGGDIFLIKKENRLINDEHWINFSTFMLSGVVTPPLKPERKPELVLYGEVDVDVHVNMESGETAQLYCRAGFKYKKRDETNQQNCTALSEDTELPEVEDCSGYGHNQRSILFNPNTFEVGLSGEDFYRNCTSFAGFSDLENEDDTDIFGANVLHYAVAQNRIDVVKHLISKRGINVLLKGCVLGLTPFDIAVHFKRSGIMDHFQKVLGDLQYFVLMGDLQKLSAYINGKKSSLESYKEILSKREDLMKLATFCAKKEIIEVIEKFVETKEKIETIQKWERTCKFSCGNTFTLNFETKTITHDCGGSSKNAKMKDRKWDSLKFLHKAKGEDAHEIVPEEVMKAVENNRSYKCYCGNTLKSGELRVDKRKVVLLEFD